MILALGRSVAGASQRAHGPDTARSTLFHFFPISQTEREFSLLLQDWTFRMHLKCTLEEHAI